MSTNRVTRRRAVEDQSDDSGVSTNSGSKNLPVPPKRGRRAKDLSPVGSVVVSHGENHAVSQLAEVVRNYIENAQPREVVRRHHVNGDGIPEFNPDDKHQTAEVWLHKVEQLKRVNEWNEATTIHYATAKLAGLAKTWYQSLKVLDRSWAEWKVLIANTFPTELNYPVAMEEMLARKKKESETYITYYYEKLALLNRLEIEGPRAVSFITHGILDLIVKNTAEGGRHQTPESLFLYLSSISPGQPKGGKPFKQNAKNAGGAQRCSICGKRNHQTKDCWCAGSGKSKVTEPPKGDAGKSQRGGDNTCFYCKEVGHIRHNCPKLKKKLNPSV